MVSSTNFFSFDKGFLKACVTTKEGRLLIMRKWHIFCFVLFVETKTEIKGVVICQIQKG